MTLSKLTSIKATILNKTGGDMVEEGKKIFTRGEVTLTLHAFVILGLELEDVRDRRSLFPFLILVCFFLLVDGAVGLQVGMSKYLWKL